MHLTTTLFALVAPYVISSVVAVPLTETSSNAWPAAVLETCNQAVNCKVINGVPQVDYDHAKRLYARDGGAIGSNATSIVPNDGQVQTSTCQPGDMVHAGLFDHCKSTGGCSTDTRDFQCVQPNTNEGNIVTTCTITQDGQYGGSDFFFRNMFAAALEASARSLTTSQNNTAFTFGKRIVGQPIPLKPDVKTAFTTFSAPQSITATNTFVVDEEGHTAISGFVRYTLTCQQQQQSGCGSVLAAGGAAAGILALLEPEIIGPVLAAALGVVTPFCS